LEADVKWDKCLQHAAVTDIGMRRASNQDSHAVVLASDMEMWRERGHLFVVADGMGAHAAGELASEMAVSGITHRYYKYSNLLPPEALHKAIQDTNDDVHQRGQANIGFHNMGTTASALVLLPQGALVAHVGDSRVYRQRGARLDQLTFDHSLAWEIQNSGRFHNSADFASAVPKNIITRSLGPNETVQVDFEGPFPVGIGDTFLLCSDGLTGLVEDEEIGPILANLSPAEASQALTDLANLRGGHDNITAVVVRVTGAAMTTGNVNAHPHHGQRGENRGLLGSLPWIIASVCFLAALAMAVLERMEPALIALILACVATLVAVLRRWVLTPHHPSPGKASRYGKGPYVTVNSTANAGLTGKLAQLVDELRSATEEGQWSVDVQGFNVQCEAAEQAAGRNEHESALKHYVHAISYMMKELRRQGRQRDGQAPPQPFGS